MKLKIKNLFIVSIILLFSNSIANSADDLHNSIYLGMAGGANLNNGGKEFLISLTYTHTFEYTEPNFFIGATLESIFTNHNELALGVPLGFYATKELKFWLTPAYVFGDEKKIKEDGKHFEYGDKFMLSISSAYVFPLENNRFSIMPFIAGNIVNYEFTLALGVKFSLNFTNDFN
jgi:hypothetical protein